MMANIRCFESDMLGIFTGYYLMDSPITGYLKDDLARAQLMTDSYSRSLPNWSIIAFCSFRFDLSQPFALIIMHTTLFQ